MCFVTPAPNTPAAAAPITATSKTRRPRPYTKSASLVSISLVLARPLVALLGGQPLLGPPAPLDEPLGDPDPDLEREVRAGPAGVRLDRPQLRELAFLALAHRADVLDPSLGQDVGEEQLQHPLVAQLVQRLDLRLEPFLERPLAVCRQHVHHPRPPTRRLRPPDDQPLVLQPLELRVDLPIARRPKVPGRLIDQLLDVVPGLLPERDHSEDHPAGGGEVGSGGGEVGSGGGEVGGAAGGLTRAGDSLWLAWHTS